MNKGKQAEYSLRLVIIIACYQQLIPEKVEFATAVVENAGKVCVNVGCSESVPIVLILLLDPKTSQGQVSASADSKMQ